MNISELEIFNAKLIEEHKELRKLLKEKNKLINELALEITEWKNKYDELHSDLGRQIADLEYENQHLIHELEEIKEKLNEE
jgi:predicted  nucleic acid-binding Zn-ribbon protein